MKYEMDEMVKEATEKLKEYDCHGKVHFERKGKASLEVFVDGEYYGTYRADKHEFVD